jgi:hypothetical protein
MFLKSLLRASICLFALTGSQARAESGSELASGAISGVAQAQIPAPKVPLAAPADPPADDVKQKAQNGIGGYIAIVAISKLCDFALDPAAVNTILGNINVLKPESQLTDKELDDVLDRTVATFGKDKQKYCGPGQAGFVSGVAEMAKLAAAATEGSGIRLKPLEPPQPAAAAPVAPAGPATAMITGSDIEAIVAMAGRYGDAALTKDRNGNPYIKNRSNGAGWTISFYGCDKGADCKSIEFYHGFETDNKPTAARINEWNQKKRWSKAYLDKDGDPNISFDINLRYGVARGNLEADIGRWVETIGDFKSFVGAGN